MPTSPSVKCALPRRYRYQARQFDEFGQWRYSYEVVGERGGVHLHLACHGTEWSGGVEIHYVRRPDYMEDRPPSQRRCFLLDQPCWHDGSSLTAYEYVPWHVAGETEAIFSSLVEVADDRLYGGDEHKTPLQRLTEIANGQA